MDAVELCNTSLGTVGAVVIGRNEGQRLVLCLDSLQKCVAQVVYVDSGSTDGSLDTATKRGVSVIALDTNSPFTAARARNAGFLHLLELNERLDYVFFVDGDCEVYETWIDHARSFLASRPDVAVVYGRRRERYPERSIYNMFCEREWASFPIGETKYCGGDAVIRVAVLEQVGGYRPDLVCGEEPELCVRIRQKGWRIWHLGQDMTLHDAAIYRFSQWWTRMVRGGYGFAQGVALHGNPPERHWVRESRRAWIWGLGIPVAVLLLALVFGPPALALLSVYAMEMIRLARREGRSTRARWLWAGALVLGKFPEMLGQVKFLFDRLRRVNAQLIEYK